jgi:hypothetical protein
MLAHATSMGLERPRDDPNHFAGDVDPHLVFQGAADEIDRPMDRAIFPIENHKDDAGAVVDGFECDRCSTLFGTAEGGREPLLRGSSVGVCCLGSHGRGGGEQRGDNRQRQGKIVAHDFSSVWRRPKYPLMGDNVQFALEKSDINPPNDDSFVSYHYITVTNTMTKS